MLTQYEIFVSAVKKMQISFKENIQNNEKNVSTFQQFYANLKKCGYNVKKRLRNVKKVSCYSKNAYHICLKYFRGSKFFSGNLKKCNSQMQKKCSRK